MPAVMASGAQVVAEAIARRWLTPIKTLADDPTYGEDITDSVSDDMSPRDIVYKQQRLAVQAMQDERVLQAQVKLTLSRGILTVSADIMTANGPFAMVLSVNSANLVTLLVS